MRNFSMFAFLNRIFANSSNQKRIATVQFCY